MNESIMFNVTFENDKLTNISKLNQVLETAQLSQFIKEFPGGIHGKVGENGSKLSMGQKQRLGLARALYGDPEIIILDEATSALDVSTEKKIMNEIYDICKDKTLIVIAHRVSTTDECNKKINLSRKNKETYV
jgi:ABC-type bacteriocin/lantibiotic exporter with double-glycine peptidase domain